MKLTDCGRRLWVWPTVVSTRNVCAWAIQVSMIARATTTRLEMTTLAPYFSHRSCWDSGGVSFGSDISFPSSGFQNLRRQKQEHGCRQNKKNHMPRIDNPPAEIGIPLKNRLIDDLHRSLRQHLPARPPGHDRDREQYGRRRHRRDNLAPGQR